MIFDEKFYALIGVIGVFIVAVIWCSFNIALPAIVGCLIKAIQEFWNKEKSLKAKLNYLVGIVVTIFLLGSVKFFGDNIFANDTEKRQEQVQEQEQEPQKSVEYYIINAEHELYSYEEINELSNEELCKLRNGIYAWRGLRYKGVLGVYYEEFDWYNPKYNSEAEVSQYITSKEWKLIDLIKRIEDERKN